VPWERKVGGGLVELQEETFHQYDIMKTKESGWIKRLLLVLRGGKGKTVGDLFSVWNDRKVNKKKSAKKEGVGKAVVYRALTREEMARGRSKRSSKKRTPLRKGT